MNLTMIKESLDKWQLSATAQIFETDTKWIVRLKPAYLQGQDSEWQWLKDARDICAPHKNVSDDAILYDLQWWFFGVREVAA